MATHDYIISNASGAAVRADLNNALAAIVSNNSNATSPATTYAFQFWADTTTGQLKIRNAANSAWITLLELDGTMLMEDGTVSAPGLAFVSDTNTGFFRSAADRIGFATGGAERLEIGNSEVVFNGPSNDVNFRVESNGNTHMLFVDAGNDRVGIGTSSPTEKLSVDGKLRVTDDVVLAQTNGKFDFDNGNSSGALRFHSTSANAERMRVTSSGQVGIGTSSPSSLLQVNKNSTSAASGGLRIATADSNESLLELGVSTSLDRAFISSLANGSGSVRPITFICGTSSSDERMRILSSGGITFNGDTAQANALDDYEEGTWTPSLECTGQSGSFTTPIQQGAYTKIGRVVHLQFRITWSAIPSVGGHLSLKGFPFAYPATAGLTEFGGGVAFENGLNSNSYVSMLAATTGGGSRTAVKFHDDAVSAINVTTGNNIASSGDIRGSLTYMV